MRHENLEPSTVPAVGGSKLIENPFGEKKRRQFPWCRWSVVFSALLLITQDPKEFNKADWHANNKREKFFRNRIREICFEGGFRKALRFSRIFREISGGNERGDKRWR